MSNLDSILKKTKESLKEGKIFVETSIQINEQEKENRKTILYNLNSREVKMIHSLGLNIHAYEPVNPKSSDYDAAEHYYCSNERWEIEIRNLLYDPDLGSILQVHQCIEKSSHKEIEFYSDLWCQNTSSYKLEQFKSLISGSFQDYLDAEFGLYYDLPQLLRQNGFEVKENNFTFDANKCLGFLEIKNPKINKQICKLTINHYNAVQTQIEKLDNDRYFNEIIYPFEYKEEDDIIVLCEIIDCFLEHMDGKHGFFEKGSYYTNENVQAFFDTQEKLFDRISDTTTYWQHQWDYENMTASDLEEYDKKQRFTEINHHNGAEIYKSYAVELNEEAEHFGGSSHTYAFEIIYNTTLDKENCIVQIRHTESKHLGYNNIDRYNKDIENTTYGNVTDVTLKGSFGEVMKTIEDFLKELSEIKDVR